MSASRARVIWKVSQGTLTVFEPSAEDVAHHASTLAAAYNEPHNRAMMGHAEMTAEDVREHFAAMREEGARLFLLELDGELMGDADFRNLEKADAEFAIMIGGRNSQGKGLGTRFALMLHAWAFRTLALEKIYITVIEANAASRRLFEKLGYQVDESPEVRAHFDDPSDLGMSISQANFISQHVASLEEITNVH
jgi:RimJ/RimL family protein N-acetyltransferase